MPARVGDVRTSTQKEEDAKRSIYALLKDEWQSWGTLRKAATRANISSATLSKYLKKFIEDGIALKDEENSEHSKLSRTYYRLKPQKLILGDLTQRDMFAILKSEPGIEFSEEEERVWGYMDTALKIFTWNLAHSLAYSSSMEVDKASQYVETMFQVNLKEKLLKIIKLYQKYKNVKNDSVPIASFAAESVMIEAEESAAKWIPKDLLEKYRGGLPEPEISIAWNLLTSCNEKEAIKKIENEIDELQQALVDSYKQ